VYTTKPVTAAVWKRPLCREPGVSQKLSVSSCPESDIDHRMARRSAKGGFHLTFVHIIRALGNIR